MVDRRLRRACEARTRDLALKAPLGIEELCAHLEKLRGRQIRLSQIDIPDNAAPCGLWVATPGVDYVFYGATPSAVHRAHIIRHELAHIICGHEGALAGDDLATLLPNLSPTTIQRVLSRSAYTAVEEQEAELLASLMAQRAAREPAVRAGDPSTTTDAAYTRLRSVLE